MQKMLFVLSALLASSVASVAHEKSSYHGYQVLRTMPKLNHQLHLLREIQLSDPEVDFWSEPKSLNMSVDMMVHKNNFETLKLLDNARIAYSILIDDVQKIIDDNEQSQTDLRAASPRPRSLSFTQFHRVDKIYTWMKELVNANSNVKLISIGQSSEGRDLKVIKIGGGSSQNKPAVWIDAGIHAREWIAPATATYIINQLVNNGSYSSLTDSIDWYILPVVNPDGYEYTHTNIRLWRKTRSDNPNGCKGTDGNRNWGFHWNEGGASSSPCSDTYRGTRAFSEPETKAIADFILDKKNDFKVFLTLHSYGQMWLTPWGYTSALPADYNELVSLAQRATKSLQAVHGTKYTIGSSTNVLYIASGGSDDWAKGAAGIKYSYTVELPDTGYHGFLLPASSIIPTGKETMEAIKVIASHVMTEFVD